MQVTVTSNIDDVIDSVDDVQSDLYTEFRKRIQRVMGAVKARAKQYVQEDAGYTGQLSRAIKSDVEDGDTELTLSVFTDSGMAPYAAIIEYGSGERTNDPWKHSERPPTPSTGSAVPRGFPFEAPDINTPPEENKYKLTGYPEFAGFVGHIEEWMQKKPVEPESGDLFTSAVAIAWTIANRGNLAHPFMRPAWFDKELQVKNAATNALRNATR